jgi:hypothetical protein
MESIPECSAGPLDCMPSGSGYLVVSLQFLLASFLFPGTVAVIDAM